MLGAGAVQVFGRQAQLAKSPAGLYGIFGNNERECETLWRHLKLYAGSCDDVTVNAVQREVTFNNNGARVRIFNSTWRTYHGLRLDAFLLSDESISNLIRAQIITGKPKPVPVKNEDQPRFGL